MVKCVIRWRPSGGRGEYEFVPSGVLVGRGVTIRIDQFGVDIPSETVGTVSQGKPRLRKLEPNNRKKLHLVPLVMAIARLPDPAREDKAGTVTWPLENKEFVVSHMLFDVVEDDGSVAVLKPLEARILHSAHVIDLQSRLNSLATDLSVASGFPALAKAIAAHEAAIHAQTNSIQLREAADAAIAEQVSAFGSSNSAPISAIVTLAATTLEDDITGKEGRIFTRIHSVRERDRLLVRKAKKHFKAKHGSLYCECCGLKPADFYGARGEDRVQAHHRTPIEELMPDTETKAADLAMVCPNCHDIIHAKRPWLSVEELHEVLQASGKHYFK